MISAVIPVFNEQESLGKFYPRLLSALKKLDEAYEIIFVDDGSTDSTLSILKKIAAKDKNVRIFSFRINQGKAEALTLGFQKSKGELVVTLDADLQDQPEEISKLLKKLDNGWDCVSGWRKNRKDSLGKLVFSKLFNLLASTFWRTNLHDYNCGLKVYTSDAAKSLSLYGGRHRFIPLLLHEQGFKVTEIPVIHDKRKFGKSKYGISKVFKDLPDIFTMLFLSKYAKRPLHFFGSLGGFMLFLGTLISLYLTILWFQGESIGRRPLLLLGILLIVTGFQTFFTGFLADLIIHLSEKNRANGSTDKKYSIKYES